MLGYCDVYKFRGHYWNTPLYNESLGQVEQIFKCRCGAIKSRTKKVPLPDTEEFKALHESDYEDKLEDESENNDEDDLSFYPSIPFIVITAIVGLIIFIVIMPIITSSFMSIANVTDVNSNHFSSLLGIVFPLIFIFGVVLIVNKMFRGGMY